MKYLLLILIVGLVFFVLGLKRSRPPAPPVRRAEPEKPAANAPDIVACAQCGLHVPRSEALPGRGGLFCSAAHRAAFEAEQGA
ncbi:MAG TPA: PP0621 family protein [Roseateles sp.]|nr:PP0621 family protein [Roseateles sp.]